MKRAAVLAAAFLVLSCATGRPTGGPVAPLTPGVDVIQQLATRRANFHGMRSLMNVRATVKGKTQSFRAQLAVHDAQRMELTAYTPVGTTALKMKAKGDAITTDPPVAPEAFAFLRGAGLTPAQMAMLLLGIPPVEGERYDYGAGGLLAAYPGGLTVTFEPPLFPAKRVVVTDGDDRIEIEHIEVVTE